MARAYGELVGIARRWGCHPHIRTILLDRLAALLARRHRLHAIRLYATSPPVLAYSICAPMDVDRGDLHTCLLSPGLRRFLSLELRDEPVSEWSGFLWRP